MRKLFLLLTTLCASALAQAITTFTYGNLNYFMQDDGSVYVTYKDRSSHYEDATINVPETVEFEGATYTVTGIGAGAFRGCKNLTEIHIPATVDFIGNNAFNGCENVEVFQLPNNLKTIDAAAFFACSKITEINIPGNVTKLGKQCFASCKALKNITVPSSVVDFGENMFQGCTALETVELPQSVVTIPEYTFDHCVSLTTISFSDKLEIVDNYAFQDCKKLEKIELPEGLRTIGTYAFSGCDLFTSATIPSTVTLIKKFAYKYSAALRDVYVKSSTPCPIYGDTFNKTTNTIHVPKGSIESYRAAIYWQDLKLVDDIDETNGVMQIESESHESTLYSVSGVKVTNPRKGQVLIKKGKKVVY